jgi:hypothetical protein
VSTQSRLESVRRTPLIARWRAQSTHAAEQWDEARGATATTSLKDPLRVRSTTMSRENARVHATQDTAHAIQDTAHAIQDTAHAAPDTRYAENRRRHVTHGARHVSKRTRHPENHLLSFAPATVQRVKAVESPESAECTP